MIPGIEILSEYTAGGTPVAGIVIFATLAVIGLIFLFAGIACGDEDVPKGGIFMFVISLTIIFLIIFTAEPEHTRYKVTISDDVRLVEFGERYEILDTEGKTYTIREVTEE